MGNIKKNSFSKHTQIIEEIVEECNTFSHVKPAALFLPGKLFH